MKTNDRLLNKKMLIRAMLEVALTSTKIELIKLLRFRTMIGISFFLTILFTFPLNAQNINTTQWRSVGGQKIMSGNHNFTTSWSSSIESRKKGLYWKGYWGESNPKYEPWNPVVAKSVAPKMGQFTVQGPGHVGVYAKTKGASIVMYIAGTKEIFHPCNILKNFNPKGEFFGKISDNSKLTIEVHAIMGAYNNMNMTGEFSYYAPQEITEFEVWFFPEAGGKIIEMPQGVNNSNSNNNTGMNASFDKALGKPCGTDKEFVRSLYQSVLGRDLKVSFSNNGGSHLRKLQNGDDRWKVIWNFFHSKEYKNKHKNHREFIRDAYQSILGREPAKNEIAYWPKVDRGDILRKFFNSNEYHNLLKNCSNNLNSVSSLSIAGTWHLDQNNGYTGIMNLQQSSNGHFAGNVTWNGNLKGTIDATITGNIVNITIDYHNGVIGYYSGTLTADGTKIINGSVKGNNGVKANWTGVKSKPLSNQTPAAIVGQWKWFNNVIVTIYPDNSVKGSNGGVGFLSQNHKSGQVIYVIDWNNGQYIDRLTLKGDVLDGNNQNGTHVWGKRIRANNNMQKDNIWAINSANLIYNRQKGFWKHIQGQAQDIGVGANGAVWITGIENHRYGGNIYHLVGNRFVKTTGQAVRLDVDPTGRPWAINNLNDIYYWQNKTWHRLPGKAKDIGIGANGDVWIIGTDFTNGNYGIYHYVNSNWVKVSGAAVRIDVDPQGNPWVVNVSGDIYKFSNNTWQHMPGKAKDISIDNNGYVWIIGENQVHGGYDIYKWIGTKWLRILGGATNISVGGF